MIIVPAWLWLIYSIALGAAIVWPGILTARKQAPMTLFAPVVSAAAFSLVCAVLYSMGGHSALVLDLALLLAGTSILLACRVQSAWRLGGGESQIEKHAEELRARIKHERGQG